MTKTIFTILVFLMITFGYSQNRIGSTVGEVKIEFSPERYDLKYNLQGDIQFIQITQRTASTLFIFGKDGVCTECRITPTSSEFMTEYTHLFYNRYINKGPGLWYGEENGIKFRVEHIDDSYFNITKR